MSHSVLRCTGQGVSQLMELLTGHPVTQIQLDRREGGFFVRASRVSVEEVLVVDEGVRVAELHDLLVRLGGGQHPQARPRVEQQRRPQHLSE